MKVSIPQQSLSPFSHSMGDLVKGEVRTIDVDKTVGEAARSMCDAGIGSLVVMESDHPVGILTKTDLVSRVLVPERNTDVAVREILTGNLVTIERDHPIFEGLLLMIQHGIGHLVVTEGGRLAGVVSERDWLTFQERHPAALFRLFEGAKTCEELAALRQKANRQVRYLFLHEGTAEALTRFVTEINDRVARRVIELSLENLFDEWGHPPVPFAWMAMGSEGREEQTLSTDQDNGLVFQDVPEDDFERVRDWFLRLASRVVDGLDLCGFPRCKGNVMASNPELCLPLGGWRRKFSGYLAAADEEALLRASIYFDFRCLFGEASLVDSLWEHLLVQIENSRGFLRYLAGEILEGRPPVNTFGWRFRNLFGLPQQALDLKKQALAPLVASARILALACGTPRTNTLARLESAWKAGVVRKDLALAASGAYEFLMLLRIRQHFQQQARKQEPSNLLEVKALDSLNRGFLNEALQTVIDLQDHVASQYCGVSLS